MYFLTNCGFRIERTLLTRRLVRPIHPPKSFTQYFFAFLRFCFCFFFFLLKKLPVAITQPRQLFLSIFAMISTFLSSYKSNRSLSAPRISRFPLNFVFCATTVIVVFPKPWKTPHHFAFFSIFRLFGLIYFFATFSNVLPAFPPPFFLHKNYATYALFIVHYLIRRLRKHVLSTLFILLLLTPRPLPSSPSRSVDVLLNLSAFKSPAF